MSQLPYPTLLTCRPPFQALPLGGFGLVYADPNWKFDNYSPAGEGRNPSRHYDCMPTAEIAKLPVADLAAPDCALFLWGTWPMLPDALRVMAAWGFRYSTGGSWHKLTAEGQLARGPGYRFMSASEPFLLGIKGAPRSTRGLLNAIDTVEELDLAQRTPRREHSRKPAEARDLVEQLFPSIPKVELFARTTRPGWSAWGNEIDKFGGEA